MKMCPKCKKNHDKNGIFCSRNCANARIQTKDIRKRKSDKLKHRWEKLSEKEKQILSKKQILVWAKRTEQSLKNLLVEDFNLLSYDSKRLRILIEQNHACDNCKLASWCDHQIVLELDHRDGNRENNSRENLRGLCPNCHSLTPNWRGRKIAYTSKDIDTINRYRKILSD